MENYNHQTGIGTIRMKDFIDGSTRWTLKIDFWTGDLIDYVKKGDRNPSKQTNYRGNKNIINNNKEKNQQKSTTKQKQQINWKMCFEALLVWQKKNKME